MILQGEGTQTLRSLHACFQHFHGKTFKRNVHDPHKTVCLPSGKSTSGYQVGNMLTGTGEGGSEGVFCRDNSVLETGAEFSLHFLSVGAEHSQGGHKNPAAITSSALGANS